MADDELSAPLGQKAQRKKRPALRAAGSPPACDRGRARAVRLACGGLGAGGRRSARRRAHRGGRDRSRCPKTPADASGGGGRRARAAMTDRASRRTVPARRYGRCRRQAHRPAPRPSPSSTAPPASGRRSPIPASRDVRAPLEQRLLETSRHGAIPRIAPDGARPAEIYARAVTAASAAARTDPRSPSSSAGLGISANVTKQAMAKLPGPVTFAFSPYGADVEAGDQRPRRGPRGAAAGADGAVRLSRQRSRPADAADHAQRGAESRPPALADEPLPGLCRHRQLHGRALHRNRSRLWRRC